MKNNLFGYATSELSQDAFLCWLVSFALEGAKSDVALQVCAREMLKLFVPELREQPFALTDIERQVMHIDVLLTITTGNQIYKIAVEDKTFTSEHDNQLVRYLDSLRNIYPECKVCGVYYKMGFQSDLSQVRAAGYQIVTRAQILALMGQFIDRTENNIFLDYYEWWNNYQQETLLYQSLPLAQWRSPQIYAFYDDLQNSNFAKERSAWMGYGYVSNPNGGFVGLWTGLFDNHMKIQGANCEFYLQIEPEWDVETQKYTFPIRLKLSLQPVNEQQIPTKEIRNIVIYDKDWQYQLILFNFYKPKRLATGKTMTIGEYAAVSNNASQFQNSLVSAFEDYQRFLEYLKKDVSTSDK